VARPLHHPLGPICKCKQASKKLHPSGQNLHCSSRGVDLRDLEFLLIMV
jgi:hypothetical protein